MEVNAIVIGGSAGSFKIVVEMLTRLPKKFDIPVVLCLHRLKHIRSGFAEALSLRSNLKIVEPFDKDEIIPGRVYLAPANYHLLVGGDNCFHLSVDEATNHSRPSIDLLMTSAAHYFEKGVLGILLSGANRDGAAGMKSIFDHGGKTVVQNPEDAQVNTMPNSCLELFQPDFVFSSEQIIDYITSFK